MAARTAGMPSLDVRAAVLTALDTPLALRDVELDRPHAGEVLVRMVASGVCHSDLSMVNGTLPITLPAVLGHEGAGIVEEVGEGVDGFSPGDHVVISWIPQCGECFFCGRGQPQLCSAADVVLAAGGLLDGTPRFRMGGLPLQQMLGAGTFAEATVVDASALIKVPDDLDLTLAALLGCAVLTGVGAALNTATIRPGDTVAVVGCGGVGLNIVQGARMAGAGQIVAVDVHSGPLELAARLGATATVDASSQDAVGAVFDLTGQRGADVAFEAIGRKQAIEQAVMMTRRGGQIVLVGIPRMDVMLEVPVMLGLVMSERSLKGCWYGSADVRRDVPRLIDGYRSGDLRLDELVSRRIGLDGVNQALDDLRTGGQARAVIVY
ncbi:MAG: S-(hydroxymethyl)glutathione dehydrogenase / alcohol dehydrogenase [Actinomycetota bacterium]|nr:S-(hydroxymethyl)glutathione dehydrogenase / alcohol dehydrogenase [Actinomycetota bacterium]